MSSQLNSTIVDLQSVKHADNTEKSRVKKQEKKKICQLGIKISKLKR